MRTACSFLLYRPQPKTCVQALRPSRDNPRRPLAQVTLAHSNSDEYWE